MALVRRDRFGFEPDELWRRVFDGDSDSGWISLEEFADGDDLVVRAQLPGIDPDRDIDLSVADGVLRISAHRQERAEEKDKDTYRSEFRYGSFVRNVALPAGTEEGGIKASYKDGILEVRVPVGDKSQTEARKISINRAGDEDRHPVEWTVDDRDEDKET
jgi:HSP20 family protein